jgi:hypothetical protein
VQHTLSGLYHTARNWQRFHLLTDVLERLDQPTSLADLASSLELTDQDIAARLGLALYLYSYPALIERSSDNETVWYHATRNWRSIIDEHHTSPPALNEAWAFSVIDAWLGDAPDLYRRSLDARTNSIVLFFSYPAVACQRYAIAIHEIAQQTGMHVAIGWKPRQDTILEAARKMLPEDTIRKTSFYLDRQTVTVVHDGDVPEARLEAAQMQFSYETGWQLELQVEQRARRDGRMEQNAALHLVRSSLADTDCRKVGVDVAAGTLILRFRLPDALSDHVHATIERLADQTNWHMHVHPEPDQNELLQRARQVLPETLRPVGSPSVKRSVRELWLTCAGQASEVDKARAIADFGEQTGWTLVLCEED